MSPRVVTKISEPPSPAVLHSRRKEILDPAARQGAAKIRVFGTVARGDITPTSDIDLLVEFEATHRGLDLFAFAPQDTSSPRCNRRQTLAESIQRLSPQLKESHMKIPWDRVTGRGVA